MSSSFCLVVAPEFIKDTAWNTVAVTRGLVTSLLPVIVLLLTGLPSHEFKAGLVYWHWTNPYPGSQAFTKLAPADARIDMATLAKSVGALPTEPAEQNSKWYKLYRMVIDDRTVVEAHKLYLMYRDMAALSFPLIMVAPTGMYFFGASPRAMWTTAARCVVQYAACCLGDRNSCQRFVQCLGDSLDEEGHGEPAAKKYEDQ